MPNRNNVHVVPTKKGWGVMREGMKGAYSDHRTQKDAIEYGRTLRGPNRGELFIHGRDGRIRARDTAPGARDAHPPKG